jgi:hypothetical protein
MSGASAMTGLVFRHTGRVLGGFYQELPAVDTACHRTLTGFLDWLEVASCPCRAMTFHRSPRLATISKKRPRT